MIEKRELYVRLIRQGVTNSAACRQLGIDREIGHWWKNGGAVTRNGVIQIVEQSVNQRPPTAESTRYLSEDERGAIADGLRSGRSVERSLSSWGALGRA